MRPAERGEVVLFASSYLALWLVALLQLPVIVLLLQRLERLRLEAEKANGGASAPSLLTGSVAPDFLAIDLATSRPFSSTDLRGTAVVLLFVSVDCVACRQILSNLSRVDEDLLDGLTVYCVGGRSACEARLAGLVHRVPVLIRAETDVPQLYGLTGVPAAIVFDPAGLIDRFIYPSSAEDVVVCVRELAQNVSRKAVSERAAVDA